MTPPEGDLEPIRILMADADLRGWVYTQGERMTDILSAGEPFSFLSEDDMSQCTSEPGLRLPGTKHRVLINAGVYQVAGTALLRPGEQDDPILRATRRFLPLTEASFVRGDGPAEEADVVIVNLRRTSSFDVA